MFKESQPVKIHINGAVINGEIAHITSESISVHGEDGSYRIFNPNGFDSDTRFVTPIWPHMTVLSFKDVVVVNVDGKWVTNYKYGGKRVVLDELPPMQEVRVLYHP